MNRNIEKRATPLLNQHRSQTKKTTSTDRDPYKGSSSSTPKTRFKPEILDDADIVVRRRNPQTFSQNLAPNPTLNVNVTVRKPARPISYQHVPNKVQMREKTPSSSTTRLKQAKSIPTLLEDTTNKQPRQESSQIRGKTGKEHHQHHHHHPHQGHHPQPQSTVTHESGNPASSSVAAATTTVVPTPIPRTASASANLNVLAGQVAAGGKSARGKGATAGSRERLVDGSPSNSGGADSRKVVQQQQSVGVRGNRPVSGESLVELEQMQRQLHEMAAEKSALMLQLEERIDQVNELQNEIKVLKIYQEQAVHELEQKAEENAYLRSKLRDVVHSPLSDSEKQQLLLMDSHRHHSSAPASIAVNVPNESGDATACPTPEWDKHSSSNVSDVSVACLQDKINQMQETHYSTHEELQATLQELTDLQRQLTELQLHNTRLGDEKNLMFDSLCRQTDRLKETRSDLDNLKQLLNTTQDNSEAETTQQYADREAQLLDIVQRLEVERDNLRDRQQELLQDLQQLRISQDQGEEERSRLIERVRMLEGSVDAKVAENRQTEQELSQIRDECSISKIEIDRLKDILESARTKIVELEQDRDLSDKSELDELLDAARKEKDTLELEITHLREQVARSRNEIEKLREQVSILQEECKVTRNNAKCTQSELDYKVETLISDKTNLIEQLQRLQEAVGDFEVQNQCLNEDKRQLNGVLSETQRNLSEAEGKFVEVVENLGELKKLREAENEEWEKFQNDLLTSVRVANDFKTEAQQDLQKIVMENKGFREKVRQLEIQIEKLKGGASESSLVRSSIRRSIHVTPRKLEEGSGFIQKSPEKDDEAKSKEPNTKEVTPPENKKKASKLKDHENSKLIILEGKAVSADIQDGELIPDAILSKSLHDINATIDELKSRPVKRTKGHERSLSNFESQSISKLQDVAPEVPRKNTVDIGDTTVYTGILAKPVTKQIKTKQPKSRSKTTKSLEKLLTEADEQKLRILGEMLAHIDVSVPLHLLTEEDRSLLKLKAFYDSREMYRHKPIAKKPKDELCISNPLLNSVFANPALKKIAEDPSVPTIEPICPKLELQESFYFTKKESKRYNNRSIESATMLEDGLPERHNHRQTYSTFKPYLNKSQSVSNLCDKTYQTASDEEASLKRFFTEEDLSKTFVIAPSDSKLSLNLWTGTYTFSKHPKHRTESESSHDSDLYVYTVNDDINRSSSFVYESPQESLERRRREKDSLGHLKPHEEAKKSSKSKKVPSEGDLESSGRFRKFVGGLFGSKENLGVIHETRNTIFAPKPKVISIEADVHHSHNSLERPSSSIVYYEIPKEDFERRKSLEEVGTKLADVICENVPKQRSSVFNFDNSASIQSKFEVQEKNVYLDFEDEADLSPLLMDSSNSPTSVSELSKLRKTTDSLKRSRALAESLCRSNFTEEEIQLVQRVVETSEDSQSRPQSDINNDDIIVIEWIDYCDQCREVGTIPLSLEEYSREIKSGRSISELDKVTRRSTDLNERESSLRKPGNEGGLNVKRANNPFLNDAQTTTSFLDQDNLQLLQNFAKESSKKRASIKLDTLERKYSLKDDLDELPKEFDIRTPRPNVRTFSRSSSEINSTHSDTKEFCYVEELLDSWKSKTRRKMRNSIESAGFELCGPVSLQEPIYQNTDRTPQAIISPNKELTPPNKTPKASPRSIETVSQPDVSPILLKMSDDKKMAKKDDESDSGSLSARATTTLYLMPTLEKPDAKPDGKEGKQDNAKKTTEAPSSSSPATRTDLDLKRTSNNSNMKKSHDVVQPPSDYPTLERVAVSHVLNNNLPIFGKLSDCIKDAGSATSGAQAASDDVQPTKFQIASLRRDSMGTAANRESYMWARNRFLQAEEEDRSISRGSSPRGSLRREKKTEKD